MIARTKHWPLQCHVQVPLPLSAFTAKPDETLGLIAEFSRARKPQSAIRAAS
jgi:hypothetical protein